MKKTFTLILSLLMIFSFYARAQKGLLWKITGNDTQKPSYIYGNMHVSEKIAFRLGTEFFDAISSVDKVALESTPLTWLDEIMNSELASGYIGSFDIDDNWGPGFYTDAFTLKPPDNRAIKNAMAASHYFSNWMLYRENKSNSDFEEETFLDLFIYQAGAKRGKQVVGLEDFKKTSYYVDLARIPDKDNKVPAPWFKKMMKGKSYNELMTEAYRKQNIGLLDSISKETSGYNSHYWMIVKRNEVMAGHIDSIIRSGTSLFAGVGAAHLAGRQGILELLRQKGYTVEAMPYTFNEKAMKLREEYDDKKLPPADKDYHPFESDLFSVEVPVKMYETPYNQSQRQFFGPDLTNGTNYLVKQISTFGLLYGKNSYEYFQKIDSLIYEYTAGTIEKKEKFMIDDFAGSRVWGFDVSSRTKSKDYQRVKIYITPMNIFIFKMAGKDDFVKDYGDRFFNSIRLKTPGSAWSKASPVHQEFSIEVPDYHHIGYNQKVTSLYGPAFLEALDGNDSTYYVLEAATLNNFKNIEEDDFEVKRIVEQFLVANHFDTLKATLLTGLPYPAAEFKGMANDSVWLHLRSVIHGTRFYLLVAANKKPVKSSRFFDSFRFQSPRYLFPEQEIIDSFMLFTVRSNYLSPDKNYYKYELGDLKRDRFQDKKNGREDKSFEQKIRYKNYYSENYERIQVKTRKFNDFASFDNIDSLWKARLKYISTTPS